MCASFQEHTALTSAYDTVPYYGPIVPLTSPAHLNLCSRWHGFGAPPLSKFRLVELGCGDGTNLVSLAFYHPSSKFVGIDYSTTHIEIAQRTARTLGLQNVDFIRADVCDLEPATFYPSEYVIAHGLYSWVRQEARDAILRFCRENLSSDGLAYVSYNSQPGWAVRSLVRETLLRSTAVRDATLEQKAEVAIRVAAELLKDWQSRDNASAVLLIKEFERVIQSKPFYVLHEYLAEVNEGFWLGDFVAQAREHGLEYITDAQFCRWEGRIAPELKAALKERNLSLIEQEELSDLMSDRYFHASVLQREGAPRGSSFREAIFDRAHVASSLSAVSNNPDWSEGVVQSFVGTFDTEITIGAAITKAAIVLLSAQWPAGLTLSQLVHQAHLLLPSGSAVPSDLAAQLKEDFTVLFEAGQLDLRLQESHYTMQVPDLPGAHALARFEATFGKPLSTPYHLPITLGADALTLIAQLDGTRSEKELSDYFGTELVNATIPVLARWGLLG